MFSIVIVFCKTLDPPSDLTDKLFKRLQQLECAVVSAYFKLSTKNVATKMAQRIDERLPLFARNRVFAFRFRERAAEIRNRLRNSGPYDLRIYAVDAEVASVAIDY